MCQLFSRRPGIDGFGQSEARRQVDWSGHGIQSLDLSHCMANRRFRLSIRRLRLRHGLACLVAERGMFDIVRNEVGRPVNKGKLNSAGMVAAKTAHDRPANSRVETPGTVPAGSGRGPVKIELHAGDGPIAIAGKRRAGITFRRRLADQNRFAGPIRHFTQLAHRLENTSIAKVLRALRQSYNSSTLDIVRCRSRIPADVSNGGISSLVSKALSPALPFVASRGDHPEGVCDLGEIIVRMLIVSRPCVLRPRDILILAAGLPRHHGRRVDPD